MPRMRFEFLLDGSFRMFVEFEVDHGKVRKFLVKLEKEIAGRWVELQRYDCWHGSVHKHIMKPGQGKVRTIMFEFFDPAASLNAAIRDFQENYERIGRRDEHGN